MSRMISKRQKVWRTNRVPGVRPAKFIRQDLHRKRSYFFVKRIFDFIFSLAVIVFVLSWLIPVVALLIKVSSRGPVFFIQKRVGYLGRSFYCYKFRTMRLNAEANSRQAAHDDPRITRIGKILRDLSLDEMPQFFNVLRGDMSVIGPRPHMHADCRSFSLMVKGYKLRNLVKPGITGLAQIKGYRGPAQEFEPIFRRFQWDSFYVRNCSIRLDLRVLKLTLKNSLVQALILFRKIGLPALPELNAPRTELRILLSKNEAYERIANLFPVENIAPGRPKVSAVIITLNEEKIIRKTLSKLYWCDEILIIDSGSTDNTLSICREFNCSIQHRKFTGFGGQKQYGVSLAKNDWILCLDADEVLSDRVISEIQHELQETNIGFAGFRIPRALVFMDSRFHFGREANDFVVRLFCRTQGNWDGAIVHEKVELRGEVKNLKGKIFHYSYSDYAQFLKKIDLYSTLGAQRAAGQKKAKSKLLIAASLPFNFFKYYILDRNFLNGFHGFIWSVMNAYYHLLKYLKVAALKVPVVEMPAQRVSEPKQGMTQSRERLAARVTG